VTVIPAAAVQRGPDQTFVYVVNSADQAVHIRNIQVGPGEDDVVSVTGIDAGEVVVTDGTDKLQDGTKVVVTMAKGRGGGATTRASHRGGARKRNPATAPAGGGD
jgi:membrane fusion protein, multidrug efflux system